MNIYEKLLKKFKIILSNLINLNKIINLKKKKFIN